MVERINPDYICGVDIYDPEDIYYREMSPLARRLIERYEINFYRAESTNPEDILKVLRSQSIQEFIKNLTEYADTISAFAEEVEKLEEIEREERKERYAKWPYEQ
jgi:hypothetical protein